MYTNLRNAHCAYILKDALMPQTVDNNALYVYFMLQLMASLAYILSHTAFLLVRLVAKHKLLAEMWLDRGDFMPQVETILALKLVSNVFINAAFAVSMYFLFWFLPVYHYQVRPLSQYIYPVSQWAALLNLIYRFTQVFLSAD